MGWFVCPSSAPLLAVALSFGVVNSAYFSFAVDLVSGEGNPSATLGPVLYAVMGVTGFAGLFTGGAVARFGLRRVLAATLLSWVSRSGSWAWPRGGGRPRGRRPSSSGRA